MFRTYLWSLSVVFNYYIVGLTIPHMKVLQPAYLLYRLSLSNFFLLNKVLLV